MKKRILFNCLFFCLMQFMAYGQCETVFECNDNPYLEVEFKIALPEGAPVCTENDLVISIVNGFAGPGNELNFPCPIRVCLPDDIFYTGGSVGFPAGFVVDSSFPDYVNIQFPLNYSLPAGDELLITVPISAKCSLIEGLLNGTANAASLDLSTVEVQSCFTKKSDKFTYCLNQVLEEQPVYSLVTPGFCSEAPGSNLGVPFNMPPMPVEVTGTDCFRNSFEVTVDFDANVSATSATAIFSTNGSNYPGTVTTISANSVSVVFDNIPGLCTDNYLGGIFDDGTFQLLGLISGECIVGAVNVDYSVDVCTFTGGFDCSKVIPQFTTNCSFTSSTVAPEITVTRSGTGLDFCPQSGNDATLTYEAENTSPNEVAKGVVFEFTAWNSIEVNNFFLGTSNTSHTLSGLFNLNLAYSPGPGQNAFNWNGNTITINSNFITVDPAAILPFKDLDGDGIYSEMLPGDVIIFRPGLDSKCPFIADECLSAIQGEIDLAVNLSYTDQCDLNNFTASDLHQISLSGPEALFDTPLPGPEILNGDLFTLSFCIEEWDQWAGISDDPYDLGDFLQYLNVEFEYPGLTLVDVNYVNSAGSNTVIDVYSSLNQPALSLGDVMDPPLSGCFDLRFRFQCAPNSLSELIDISVTGFGRWSNCSIQCEIQLGCDDILLYPDFACQMNTGDPAFGDCRGLTTDNFEVRRSNPNDSSTPLEAAYACDEGVVIMGGTVAPQGFNFDGSISPCFFLPTEYAEAVGNLTGNFLFVGQQILNLDFVQQMNVIILGVPHTAFVFESESFFVPNFNTANIFLNLNFIFDENFIDNQPEKVENIPFFGAIGLELEDGTLLKCAELGDQWFQTYKIENVVPSLSTTVEECDNYFDVPFELNYAGGTDGPDFDPAKMLNKLVDEFSVEVTGGDDQFVPIGIFAKGSLHPFQVNGNTYYLDDITDLLAEPLLKDGCEGNSQSFVVRMQFFGDCATSDQIVTLECNYNVESISCGNSDPGTVNHTIVFQSGTVVTGPVLSPVTVVGNCVELTAQTVIVGNSTQHVVHEFEFNPLEVTIQNVAVAGDEIFVVVNNPTSSTLLITSTGDFNPGDVVEKTVEVCFIDACEPDPYLINYVAGQACGVNKSPLPDDCTASGTFEVTFVESDVLLSVDQIHTPDDYCENAVITACLYNYSLGDVVNPGLIVVNVPTGLMIERAFYRFPADENANCANNNFTVQLTPAELNDLQNEGFVVPADALECSQPFGSIPGTYSGANNDERKLLFIIEVALCGGDPETVNRTITLTGIWDKNCGSPDSETKTITIQGWEDLFDLDLALNFGDLNTICTDDLNTGSVLLNTNAAGTDVILSAGQTVTLNLQTLDPNLIITSPNLDNDGNIVYTGVVPGQVLVEFELDQDFCDATNCGITIVGSISSQTIINCPFGDLYGTCYIHEETYQGDELPLVNLPIRSVTLYNVCDETIGNESVWIRANFDHCVEAGVTAYFNAWHDLDCDGDPDVLLAETEVIAAGLDLAAFLDIDISSHILNGEEVCVSGTISTTPRMGCFCATPTAFDSTCPDYDLSYTGSNGNYTFTLDSPLDSPYSSLGEFACATFTVNGISYNYNTNPFTHVDNIPNGAELCMIISSTNCQFVSADCNTSDLCETEKCVTIYPDARARVNANDPDAHNTSIAPNPFYQNLTLNHYTTIDAPMTLNLYNITGQIVYSKELQMVKGNNELLLSLPTNFSSGIYSVVLSGQNGIEFTEKLVHIY